MSAPLDLVIRGGTVVTSAGPRRADIGVRGEFIASVAEPGSLLDSVEFLVADDVVVLPGVIDPHVHFRQPGLEHEEDWQSGSRAAVHGGVTTVLEMPNTVPPTATAEAAHAKRHQAERNALCDFGLLGLLGDDPGAVGELAGSGLVVGLKAFLGPTTGGLATPTDDELRAGLEATAAAGLRIVFHAEDAAIVGAASARQRAMQRDDALAHLDGRPAAAEAAAIERVGRLLVQTGARGHIAHLTSLEGLAAVERWRAAGADTTCEVTPHHLLLGLDVYERFGGIAKVNPPIRGEPHASGLLAALADGRIDCLASDHAPHREQDKRAASIWAVPAGFAGVETLLSLMLTEVAAGRLTMEQLARATSEGPAKAFGLWPHKGALEFGSLADLVLVDPRREGVIRAADLHGKNNASPWEGRTTTGAVVATVVRGRVVMREGELLGEPGWGRPVSRAG